MEESAEVQAAPASNELATSSYEEGSSHGPPATYVSCGSHGIAANFETIYATIFVIVIYILPVLLICLNYTNIGRFLWQVGGAYVISTLGLYEHNIILG